MRKTIAKAMLNSLQTTAQLTHTASFDASDIMDFRKKIKPLAEKGEIENITLNDIIMFAVSRTLKKYKVFSAHMLGDTMKYYNNVNLAMAVDTERGLMVPVCFAAQSKSLPQLSRELKQLALDCQKGTISPDSLKNGSFTVSNLGVFGTESFTPVLNAPQTGILGVNTIVTRVKEDMGTIKTYPCMTLSFTYDHRAAAGVTAAKFLQDLCRYLQNFTVNLAIENIK
jgi:pyruvate dehydrogenase E2 component (dihydrolipoamide acetyltransferase)